jgi:hypothetical protein
MPTHQVVSRIIKVAEDNLGKGNMIDSAALCLDDARSLLTAGDLTYARQRALKSLAYSVGILAPVYLDACQWE